MKPQSRQIRRKGSFLRKLAWSIVAALVLALLLLVTMNAIAPVRTQKAMLRASQAWLDTYPYERQGVGFFLIRRLYDLHLLGPVVAETDHGFRMELDSRDLVTRAILQNGTWEPQTVEALHSVIHDGSVVLDIGAHVGFDSLLAARLSGPTGRVIALEPNPFTAERFRRNLALNPDLHVDLEEVAASSSEGTLELYMAGIRNTGMSSLSEENANSSDKVEVRAVPVDSIVAAYGLDRVDVIKMDIEGAEMEALRGMPKTLETFHPVIVSEMIDQQLRNMGTSADEITAFLENLGYHGRPIGRNYLWMPAAADERKP